MPLRTTSNVSAALAALAVARGDAVVVVPVYDAFDDVRRCYASVLEHTPSEVPLLVVDDGSHDARVRTVLEDGLRAQVERRSVIMLRRRVNGGFVAAVNDGLRACGLADVVLVNSDVVVGPGWFGAMRSAALSGSTVASATALTNNGTILSVPERNQPTAALPESASFEECATRVAEGSLRLRPRIPVLVGHCAYLRRDALEVVGELDPTFGLGYGEEVDWSLRAAEAGFEHVVADDAYVWHRGAASFGGDGIQRLRQDHEGLVDRRYPYYATAVRRAAHDAGSPLAAALLAARRSLLGMHVLVDAMVLHPTPGGTQVGTLETIRALAALPGVAAVDALVRPHVPAYAQAVFERLPQVRVHRVEVGDRIDGPRHDVLLRPYQVTSVEECRWLRGLADRLVVNQLDLIAYHNPGYFLSDDAWLAYRDAQRLTLAVADGVAFVSEHSRRSAVDAGLLASGRPTSVVGNGVEHYAHPDVGQSAVAPSGTGGLTAGFVLVLGVPYRHKNRPFALRVLEALDERGWSGSLVLAGPTPTSGDTSADERRWLREHPRLAGRVLNLGKVDEAGKVWLYAHAGAVLYPTTSEGFGLVPFESAGFGVPCLSTRRGGLDEVLPHDIATLDGWDPSAAAEQLLLLLHDDLARKGNVVTLVSAAERYTWARTAKLLYDLMWEVTGRISVGIDAVSSEDGVPLFVRLPEAGASAHSRRTLGKLVTRLERNPRALALLGGPGSRRRKAARQAAAWVRAR